MKKKNFLSIVVSAFAGALAIGGGAAADAAEFKIGFVDLQKALQTVSVGKKAKASLEKEFNAKKKQLQAEEENLKKMTEEFKKQSMVLSEDAKHRKESELQDRMVKYRDLFGRSQMELQNRERELTEPIIEKLRSLVQDLGQKAGYSVILEKNETNVLFHQSKDDLTEEVIQNFDKKNG